MQNRYAEVEGSRSSQHHSSQDRSYNKVSGVIPMYIIF